MPLRYLAAIVLLAPVHAVGDVFSYDCDVLPLEGGWSFGQAFCDPEEWVDEEQPQLFQHVAMCEGYDPPHGQNVSYNRSQQEHVGHPTHFIEWVVRTDGDSSEIPYTAPVCVSAWNGGSVRYQAIIARDQVELIRDLGLPILNFELQEGESHTFRVELYSDTLYRWFIDGVEVDSGVPEGDYLTYSPRVYIRAKSVFAPSTAVWTYIRWGDIPLDGTGDFDSDGHVDSVDFYFFQDYFSGAGVDAGPGARWADFDFDTDVDCHDWESFTLAWTGDDDPPDFAPCPGPMPKLATKCVRPPRLKAKMSP